MSMINPEFEFISQLSSIRKVSSNDIKFILEKIQNDPKSENFWLLSKMIRLSTSDIIKPLIDHISRVTIHRRTELLAAAFASAHFLRICDKVSQNDSYKWARSIKFPSNPYFASILYNIVALPTYSSSLPQLWDLLQSSSLTIQKQAAYAISNSARSPANFLRRVLGTISNDPPPEVEQLDISNIKPTLNRGLLIIAQNMISNSINLSEYIKPILKILNISPNNNLEKTTCIEAQNLLENLLLTNPIAFHKISLFEVTIIQSKAKNLSPTYFNALLNVYGLYCIKKLVQHLFLDWVFSLKTIGLIFLKSIGPYSKFLNPELQILAQKELVNLCKNKPFDKELQLVTIIYLLSSSPSSTIYISEFLSISNSIYKEYFVLFKSLLEPKTPPLNNPRHSLMKIPEIEKKDAFTQSQILMKSVVLQCDISREISIIIPKKNEYLMKPLNINNSLLDNKIIKSTIEPDINLDSDIELDFNTKPDSDDE